VSESEKPESEAAASAAERTVADGVARRLDPRYIPLQQRTAWIATAIYSLLWLGIVWTIGATTRISDDQHQALLLLWGAAAIAYSYWGQRRPAISYRHSSYRVDESGIEIRRGVFWRSVITVPRARVQHTDVSQGPLERRFGLGTLSIHTAGSSHAMVALPGLDHERALRIRDYLLPRKEHDVV
jgi:hypothetical protein